jgi:hypothetical protein
MIEIRRPAGLESPIEHLLIEAPRALHIAGEDLEVNDVIGHAVSLK